jgi:hypothetical protein
LSAVCEKLGDAVPRKPIKMPDGELLWDVQDLDKWIDSLKAGVGDDTADAILARLEGP